jgi:hypothetical protein
MERVEITSGINRLLYGPDFRKLKRRCFLSNIRSNIDMGCRSLVPLSPQGRGCATSGQVEPKMPRQKI